MLRKCFWFVALQCVFLALMTTSSVQAQTGITAKIPTCASIGDAIAAAHEQISSLEDRTAEVQKAAARGTVPYSVLRACTVNVPGQKFPLKITIYGPLNRQFLEGMAQLASSNGEKPQKLDGAGYGDLAYLLPQIGGGNAINALVGNAVLNLGNSATAQETENMAEHIIRLMK